MVNGYRLYARHGRKFRALLCTVFCLLTIVYCPVASANSELKVLFREAVKKFNIPGAVMMVEDPHGKLKTYRTGVRKIGSRKPMSSKLKFRIGSITKTFVSSLVLMLVQEGKVSLDTEAHKILPDLVPEESRVTVRNLLHMRSCLNNFTVEENFLRLFREQPSLIWTPECLLSFETKEECSPGFDFEYNNANYVLLGLIIEKLTGDTFENQVSKRILVPLGLNSTTFPVKSSDISKPYATGHDYNPETGVISDLSLRINPSWAWCSGNGVSTATDMMVWLKAFLGGYGISEKLLYEQLDFRPVTYDGIDYGLGVMNKYTAIGHNGNFAGIYTALAFRYRGYYFVILTNGQADGGGTKATAESVFWYIVSKSELFAKSKR